MKGIVIMKKFRVILALVLSTCMLAGCTMPDIKNLIPGKNKNDVEQGGEDLPYTPEVTLNVAESYPVGTVLTYVDIATIEPEYEFEVADSAFMGDGATPGSEYTVTEGEHSVNLIIQFNNGAQYTAAITIVGGSSIPTELLKNINNSKWLYNFVYSDNGTQVDGEDNIISHSNSIYISEGSKDLTVGNDIFGMWSTGSDITFGGNELRQRDWSLYGFTDADIQNYKNENNFDPNMNIPGFTLVINMMRSFLDPDDGWFVEDADDLSNLIDYLERYVNDHVTYMTNDSGYVLYDIDGNQYNIRDINAEIDLTDIGGSIVKIHVNYYYEYKGLRVYLNAMCAGEPTTELDIIGDDEDTNEEEEFNPSSYDEFKEYISVHPDLITSMFSNESVIPHDKYDEEIEYFVNNAVIGNYEKLLNSDAPTGDVGSGNTEVPEEEDELSDAAGKSFKTYASRYPDIYTWPDNETKYRRWIYIIGENTRYTGSIINPDGTVLISGGNTVSSVLDEQISSGGQGGDDIKKGNQKYTLTSTYGSYNMSNENFGQATFDVDNSTAGRLIVNYENTKYYVETIRASRILEYQRSCLYSTNNMKDADYQVFEDSARHSTDLGMITLYTIKYTMNNGVEVTEPYMATYNINNDYLVIYADSLLEKNSDSQTLVILLEELVQ